MKSYYEWVSFFLEVSQFLKLVICFLLLDIVSSISFSNFRESFYLPDPSELTCANDFLHPMPLYNADSSPDYSLMIPFVFSFDNLKKTHDFSILALSIYDSRCACLFVLEYVLHVFDACVWV